MATKGWPGEEVTNELVSKAVWAYGELSEESKTGSWTGPLVRLRVGVGILLPRASFFLSLSLPRHHGDGANLCVQPAGLHCPGQW